MYAFVLRLDERVTGLHPSCFAASLAHLFGIRLVSSVSERPQGCAGSLVAPDVVLAAGHCARTFHTTIGVSQLALACATTLELTNLLPSLTLSSDRLVHALVPLLQLNSGPEGSPRGVVRVRHPHE
jgi:hypothetical protein